jgi:hypothetical protein
MSKVSYILAFIILGSAVAVRGTIINVPGDYSTIQQGIDASVNDDTVLVQPGTYVENINFNGHNIVLGSLFLTTGDTSYISQTTIDGDSVESVVIFESGEDSTAVILGFTIQNGDSYLGGGIFCSNNSRPLIKFNIVSENIAVAGAGIYCHTSNPLITNNVVTNNSTDFAGGGGIFCYYSNAIVQNNIVRENIASNGGGVVAGIGSNPSILNNIIIRNSAAGEIPNGFGGGISCAGSSPTIMNNIIFENSAAYQGGGMHCLFNNTTPQVLNTIFRANTAAYGNEIYNDGGSPSVTYCNIEGGWPGQGNIDVDPLFRDTASGDFHLMSITCGDTAESPCIDAGDPNISDIILTCDWGLETIICDMGAYGGGDSTMLDIEYSPPPLAGVFTLLQNYPNPFNAQTTIRFLLPEPQNVRLTVYDLLGRQVRTLLDERKQAGTHIATFDASSLSSGVYFYKLQAGDMIETKRMVLLK